MPIQWKPFKEMERRPRFPDLFEEQEEWIPFIPTFRTDEPSVDIYQDKNNLYVEIPLVGVKPEDVEISIENNILTVSGKSEEKKEVKEKDYLRKEIRRGSFQRTVKLPVKVKEDEAAAESSSGLLKITIPKVAKEISSAKRIPIKVK